MSGSTYNKTLGRKLLYRTPLFVIDVTLRPAGKVGGKLDSRLGGSKSDSLLGVPDHTNTITNSVTLYQTLIENHDNRIRFMHALHQLTDKAVLILRQIFKTKTLDNSLLTKHAKQSDVEKHLSTFHSTKLEELPDVVKKTNTSEYKIIEHEANEDSNGFLTAWYSFIDPSNVHHFHTQESTFDAMKQAGFTCESCEHKRYHPEVNPLLVYRATFTRA